MKPEEIHDLLLSLFVRGLGFWLLYSAFISQAFDGTRWAFFLTIHPDTSPNPSKPDWGNGFIFIVELIPAIYFILGAPPLLKWATRKRD